MLTHLTSFLNHGELPVAALAYSKKQDLLLVCDGRYLRLYSSRDGYRCVRAVQLPPTVRRSRTPTTVVLLSRLLHSPSLSLSLSDTACACSVWQMQAIRWMHYNLAGDHFIAVYGSHIAQVVGIELSMFEAGLLQTEQLSILGSAWCEGRQELVTAGGDGTLLFACLRHEYQITTNGRRLLSRLAPRMTISSGYMWMRQLCIDEAEERVISASDATLCVWCMRTGALLQSTSNLHANGATHPPHQVFSATPAPYLTIIFPCSHSYFSSGRCSFILFDMGSTIII